MTEKPMSKDVVAWIKKITESYATCTCGRECNINLTIENFYIKLFVYCPDCDRIYTIREGIELISEAMIDLTDSLIRKAQREFSQPPTAQDLVREARKSSKMTNFSVWADDELMLATLLAKLVYSEEIRKQFIEGLLWRKEKEIEEYGEDEVLIVQFYKWLKQYPDPHGLVNVIEEQEDV